ncbi:MAG: AmmeMemoRadiSam system protein A [Spirochaetia bacterium]|jgi:AmmeMemoRadiSam system protein A|nr:AmmeMemoRadiSam system protein A [Spirochaetia bacterium]
MMIELDEKQQASLLLLARQTIAEKLSLPTGCRSAERAHDVQKTRSLPTDILPGFDDSIYAEKCGAFVTLHQRGELRGCIGYIEGVKTIPETVMEMALSAAFKDPRFPPLKKEEYDSIDLEISILSPIEEVTDLSGIVVGRDGLIVSRGYNRGLLLPQVASEYGWDRETFLRHTCRKAGLPPDAWKDPSTRIEKFSAQVFGEKENE